MPKIKYILNFTLFLIIIASFSGCGYNSLIEQDEKVNQAWAQVENQYQRRADLIPNLVKTVQGYADFEKDVLTEVTELRSKVGQIKLSTDDLSDEEKFKQFSAFIKYDICRRCFVSLGNDGIVINCQSEGKFNIQCALRIVCFF